jgi:arylsulfatase A-like enzyme
MLLCLFLLVLALSLAEGSNHAARKPHIIFILADDLGWNDVPFRTSEAATGGLLAPNIDGLARSGVILDQYYVQPLCSPSRTSLMSGRYPYKNGLAHGVIVNGIPAALPLTAKEQRGGDVRRVTTLPEHLRDKHGYHTHMLGKWDCGMTKWANTPTFRGFDSFQGYYGAAEDYFRHNWTTHVTKDGKRIAMGSGVDFRQGLLPFPSALGEYSMDLYAREAEKLIEDHDPKRPFFLYFASQAVHWPLEAPKSYVDRCANASGGPQRRVFCGMLVALDDAIGSIVSSLEANGMLENTLFVFSTDNGGQQDAGGNNWPLRGGKFTVFEGGVKGAAFVSGRGVEHLRGTHYSGLMHITDWLPSLNQGLLGGRGSRAAGGFLDGVNVWQSLLRGDPSPRSEILHQYDPSFQDKDGESFIGQAAIRVGKYKLVEHQPNCSLDVYQNQRESPCASGWVPLLPSKTIPPPPNPTLVWLFDIEVRFLPSLCLFATGDKLTPPLSKADPLEKQNLASKLPNVVTMLRDRLADYATLNITQQLPAEFDARSNPARFGGFWTPWAG